MNSMCVDIKTEDENHTAFQKREEAEFDVLHHHTTFPNGNDSGSETVVGKKNNAKHEDLNESEIAKNVAIKSVNEENRKKNEDIQIGRSKDDLEEYVSNVEQRKSFAEKESAHHIKKT